MCLILLRYGIETRGAAPSSVVLYAIPPDQETAESRGLSKRDWRKSVLVSRVVVSQIGTDGDLEAVRYLRSVLA